MATPKRSTMINIVRDKKSLSKRAAKELLVKAHNAHWEQFLRDRATRVAAMNTVAVTGDLGA